MKAVDVEQELLVPESVARNPGCVLIKLGQVIYQRTEQRLAEIGLRTRHYTLLNVLDANGPMAQQELSRRAGIDPTTVVACIDNLENAKLAVRTRDRTDRRRSLVTLTEAGTAALAQAHALLDDLDRENFADLTETQARDLTHLLTLLNRGAALTGTAR
ncbi:MarR family winged helix-turn-helix transcriptional regulator [Nocardia sp. NPDC050712]|uniref:MarR family winged helix-turn-helix transcriptional regulator n=1 Tax=Nocardia sp. NPDC050712 TaxID=3155518 RepID=UPI0033CEDBB1